MAQSRHVAFVQFVLGIANIIFVLGGLALLGVGIWILVESDSYVDVWNKGSPYSTSIYMIVSGGMMLIIAVFGCFGAFLRSRPILMLYVSLALLLVVVQMMLIPLSFMFKEDARKYVQRDLEEAVFLKYGKADESDLTKAMDRIQQDFKCCGIDNVTDWSRNTAYSQLQPGGARIAPSSCCETSTLCYRRFNTAGDLIDADGNIVYAKNVNGVHKSGIPTYTRGCSDKLLSWADDMHIIINVLSICMLVLFILSIGFGVALLRMTPSK